MISDQSLGTSLIVSVLFMPVNNVSKESSAWRTTFLVLPDYILEAKGETLQHPDFATNYVKTYNFLI